MKYDYGLKPLKFWCQKVLPLVYDESLSYEELLCKVVAYLNGVIEDVQGLPEYIKELLSDEKLKEILGELLDELREQIARINEGDNTTASADRTTGELVWLDGKLAIMTRDILAGDRYVEDGVEVGVTGNFIYTSIEIQIDELRTNVSNTIGSLSSLTTTDKTSIVNAVNEVLSKLNDEITTRGEEDTALNGKIDDEIENRTQADTALNNKINGEIEDRELADTAINTKIGDLTQLITPNKNSLVNAINDAYSHSVNIIDVINRGAIGDGTTDNASVFTDIFSNLSGGEIILIPHGDFKVLADINVTKPCTILGGGSFMKGLWNGNHEGSILRFSGGHGIKIKSTGVNIEGIGIIGNANNIAIDYQGDAEIGIGSICGSLRNITIWQVNFGVRFVSCFKTVMENVFVHSATVGFEIGNSPTGFTSLTMINCWAASSTHGYRLTSGIYSTLINCASDNCSYGYEIYGCGGIKLLNCGVEGANEAPVIMDSCTDVVIDGLTAVDCGGNTYGSSLARVQTGCNRCTITNSQTINPKANMRAIVSVSSSTNNFIYNNNIDGINYQGTLTNDNHIVLEADT